MYGIKKYTLAPVLAFIAVMAYAQNPQTDNLRWTCTESTELRSNTPGTLTYEIQTGSSEIRISTGSTTKTFSVASVSGEWQDVFEPGSLIYTLGFGSQSGTAVLKRENGVWEFTLDFTAHPQGIYSKFVLSDVERID